MRPIGRWNGSHDDGWAMHPPFSFRSCRKENGPCTVQKKRTLRRVGPHICVPPAAGGGRLALPCGSQGRKRPALGETFGPGKSGIPSASLPAAAHASVRNSQRQRKEKQLNATTTPTTWVPSATGRQFQKPQKAQACPTASPNRRLHRYADPRAHGGPLHRSAPRRPFLLDRARPVFFSARRKRKWGVHPGWTSPLREQNPPWPPSGGPSTPVFIAHYRPHPAGPHLIPGSPEASSAVPPARPAGFQSASLSAPVSLRVL